MQISFCPIFFMRAREDFIFKMKKKKQWKTISGENTETDTLPK